MMKIYFFLCALFFLSILQSCKNNDDLILPNERTTCPILKDWEVTMTAFDYDIGPKDLYFVSDIVGFVVGINGNIYKTVNSGLTWEKQNSSTTLNLTSIHFINEKVGFISGPGRSDCLDDDCDRGAILLKTVDGGETWVKRLFADYTKIESLQFFNSLDGLALVHTNSRDIHVVKTSDGGESWSIVNLDLGTASRKLIRVDNTVFIAGRKQQIYKSNDFGKSWITIVTPSNTTSSVRDIYFYNQDIGFIDVVSGNYKTIDGGATWKIVNSSSFPSRILHFIDENEFINIESVFQYDGGDFPSFKGNQGHETFDGGETWTSSELLNCGSIGITHFPKRNLGYGINFSQFHIIRKK